MAKVHRAYRHSWWRTSKELTERDYQAMCNFASEGISLQSIAQHFCTSVDRVEEEIVFTGDYYGYICQSKPGKASDWGAGPGALKTFLHVIRAPRHEMTWQEYLDGVDWEIAYERYGDRAREAVKERAIEIADRANIELIFND